MLRRSLTRSLSLTLIHAALFDAVDAQQTEVQSFDSHVAAKTYSHFCQHRRCSFGRPNRCSKARGNAYKRLRTAKRCQTSWASKGLLKGML